MSEGSRGVRDASRSDLDALVEIERACFDPPWSAAALSGSLDDPATLALLAHEGSRVLGSALFLRLPDGSELLRVAVLPEARRRGLGRLLIEAGLDRLGPTCHLEVREGDHAARGLYESLGFAEVGRRRGYYGGAEDALLLTRSGSRGRPEE